MQDVECIEMAIFNGKISNYRAGFDEFSFYTSFPKNPLLHHRIYVETSSIVQLRQIMVTMVTTLKTSKIFKNRRQGCERVQYNK